MLSKGSGEVHSSEVGADESAGGRVGGTAHEKARANLRPRRLLSRLRMVYVKAIDGLPSEPENSFTMARPREMSERVRV